MEQATKTGKLGGAAVRGAKRWTPEQGEWVISEWQRSGLPVQRFAAQHELDPQRVYLWRKRSKPTAPAEGSKLVRPEVVEVKLDRSALSVERRMVIELVNGRRLSVAEGIDLAILERVVGALER